MRFKYFLKGAGIGIIVTTIVLAIIFAITPKEISDDEVIERAAALGMVMESDNNKAEEQDSDRAADLSTDDEIGNITELDPEPEAEAETDSDTEAGTDTEPETETITEIEPETGIDTNTETETDINTETDTETETDINTEKKTETKQETDAETETENDDETKIDTNIKIEDHVITIRPGQSSMDVSRQLATAGLVDNAEAFNKYLCDRHIDDVIQTGSFSLQTGMSYEKIAGVITK